MDGRSPIRNIFLPCPYPVKQALENLDMHLIPSILIHRTLRVILPLKNMTARFTINFALGISHTFSEFGNKRNKNADLSQSLDLVGQKG